MLDHPPLDGSFAAMSEGTRIKIFAVLVGLFFVAKDSRGLYMLGQKLGLGRKSGQDGDDL
jgi:hypothetical protein